MGFDCSMNRFPTVVNNLVSTGVVRINYTNKSNNLAIIRVLPKFFKRMVLKQHHKQRVTSR